MTAIYHSGLRCMWFSPKTQPCNELPSKGIQMRLTAQQEVLHCRSDEHS